MSNKPDDETHGAVYFLTFVGGVAAAFFLATILNTALLNPADVDEAVLRSTGGLLECLGLLRGLFAVDEKVAKVWGTPRLLEWIRQEVRRLIDRAKASLRSWLPWVDEKHSGQTVSPDPLVNESSFGDSAEATVRPSEDADPRRWIKYLRSELEDLQEEVESLREDHTERMEAIENQIDETRQRLRAAIEDTEDLVERLAIGGFQWELVSLFWFFAGVVATTWAPSLADVLLGG